MPTGPKGDDAELRRQVVANLVRRYAAPPKRPMTLRGAKSIADVQPAAKPKLALARSRR